MTRRHPQSTLFPYTTLFRSDATTVDSRSRPNASMAASCSMSPSSLSSWNNASTIPDGVEGRAARSSGAANNRPDRSEEHTSELQSHVNLVCRLLLEKKKTDK